MGDLTELAVQERQRRAPRSRSELECVSQSTPPHTPTTPNTHTPAPPCFKRGGPLYPLLRPPAPTTHSPATLTSQNRRPLIKTISFSPPATCWSVCSSLFATLAGGQPSSHVLKDACQPRTPSSSPPFSCIKHLFLPLTSSMFRRRSLALPPLDAFLLVLFSEAL